MQNFDILIGSGDAQIKRFLPSSESSPAGIPLLFRLASSLDRRLL